MRYSFSGVIVVSLLLGIGVPNDYTNEAFRRGLTQQFDGIKSILNASEKSRIDDIYFAKDYAVRLPDSFFLYGVRIHFIDVENEVDINDAFHAILSDHTTSIFIPRNGLKYPIFHAIIKGHYNDSDEVPEQYRKIANRMNKAGINPTMVFTPDTVFIKWLSRLGIVSREQQLIGWIYRKTSS